MKQLVRNRVVGVSITLTSCVLYTAADFITQEFSLDYLIMLFIRCLIQIIFSVVAMVWQRSWKDFGDHSGSSSLWSFVFITGSLANSAIIFTTKSLERLPLGDTTIIIHSDIIFTLVLSYLVLQTPITWWQGVFIAIMILGEVLVVKPEGYNHDPRYSIGIIYALLASASFGSLAVFIAGPLKHVPIEIVLCIGALVGLAFCLIMSWTVQGNAWGILSSCFLHEGGLALWMGSVLAFLAFGCLTMALRFISPSLVMIMSCFQIVLAFLVQSTVLKVIPGFGQLFGASAALLSIVMILLEQEVMDLFSE